ncbi:MAG: hypothetical protein R3B54_06820 [Bdellovibrionota bacterium]
MGFLRKHSLVIGAVLVSFLVAAFTFYFLLSSTSFQRAGMVVNRSQMSRLNPSLEDSKNRWVWVRDGYAIKEALLSGEFLSQLIDELPLLKERYTRYQEAQGARVDGVAGATHADLRAEFVRQIARELSVDFLGGDSFTFVLTARDANPLLGKRLLAKLIDRIRYLVVEEPKAAYQNSLASLRTEMSKKQSSSTLRFLDETYQSVLATSILFEAQAGKRVDVVERPAIPLESAWPKNGRLLILALALGIALGLGVEYVLNITRQPRVQTA